jgi:hypothetical protein
MNEELLLSNIIFNAIIIGIGATLVMDFFALFQQRFFSIVALNYALVGRWLICIPKGVFRHKNILLTQPVYMESVVGWFVHYGIGVIFAAIMIVFTGNNWLIEPTITASIIFGILTVIFPYFLMQPCLGFGIAAAKTPKPNVARIRSLIAHTVFGLGLYLSALINSFIFY